MGRSSIAHPPTIGQVVAVDFGDDAEYLSVNERYIIPVKTAPELSSRAARPWIDCGGGGAVHADGSPIDLSSWIDRNWDWFLFGGLASAFALWFVVGALSRPEATPRA